MLAGAFRGTFMLPAKWMRGWAWENYWILFAVTAYILCPWILAAMTVPHLLEVYRGSPAGALAAAGVFGAGWGAGALMFGLGVEALGLALGYAIILGVAATSGALIPLLVHGPDRFTAGQGALTAAALLLMLPGVAVCSLAGRWKENDSGKRRYGRGVAICVASGLLSACGNLGFVFGAEIAARARQMGAPEHLSGNAVWTLLALPLFACNAGYAAWQLRHNRTARLYRAPGSGRRAALAALMGVLWMAGMALYGAGARKLGALGPSLGWAMLMSTMVLVANATGLLTDEWRGAPSRARQQMAIGLTILLAAIAALGYANRA
jgi:L-rhamnose-H+ transport protein